MKKFKLDENLPLEAGILFREAGYDVHTVHDENLRGASDDVIYKTCVAEGRVLVTLDLDFADIRTYRPDESPGIIVLRTQPQDRQFVLDRISSIVEIVKDQTIAGKLWIVEYDRIRVRE